jgi:ribokinase
VSAPDASDRIVFCVGSINADLVMRVGGPPTGTIVADDVAVLPGGKAANVAVMVRALGLRATLIGAVGADDEGAVARAGPRAAGVDLSGVETVPEPTGLAVVLVQPDGAKTIVRTPGANAAAADRSGAVAAAIESAHDPIVVVDLEVPRPLVDAVVSAARRRRAPVVFDPSPPGEVDDRLLEGVDVITPDHVEAAALTGVATTSARCRGRRQERRR